MEKLQDVYSTDPKYRTVTVRTSDGSTIQGKVNLSSKQRLSDLFTKGDEPFIVMTMC